MPELAPADTDHMLRSTSIVQEIVYKPYQISYQTFDADGTQKLRLTFPPHQVFADGKPLAQQKTVSDQPGWNFDSTLNVLNITPGSREVVIAGR